MAAASSWKHDIGSWQSRKSLAFRQQQQQHGAQSSTTSMARDHAGGDGNTNQRHGGFLPHRSHRRGGGETVTFGPDVWLPSSHLASPVPPPHNNTLELSDVSLSAMSDVSEMQPRERASTRVFDESVISMRNSMLESAAEDQRMSWVTIFGVAPNLILEIRAALEKRCGQTVTHHWPAAGATCNWFYVEFEKHFDASRAVSLSPITLNLGQSIGNLTIGAEWCRDATFVRTAALKNQERDALQHNVVTQSLNNNTSSSSLLPNSSRMSGGGAALWTAEGRSFIQEVAARAAMEGSAADHSTRRKLKYLAEARGGSITIVDAVVGRRSVQFLPMFLLNRREAPEQRLERLIALSNKKNRHNIPLHMLGNTASDTVEASTIIVRSTSPWWLWVNISAILWTLLLLLWCWWRRQTVGFTV